MRALDDDGLSCESYRGAKRRLHRQYAATRVGHSQLTCRSAKVTSFSGSTVHFAHLLLLPLAAQRSVAKAHGLGYSRDVRRCRVLEGSIRSFEIHGQTTGIASRAACGALIPLHRPISARSPVTRPARCRSGTFAGKDADAFLSPSRRAAREQHGGARPEESHPESQERPSSIRRAHHVLGRRPVELWNAPPARSLLSRSR